MNDLNMLSIKTSDFVKRTSIDSVRDCSILNTMKLEVIVQKQLCLQMDPNNGNNHNKPITLIRPIKCLHSYKNNFKLN